MADGAVALGTDGKRRFAAFISYAHADAAIAAKLQAKLERYRLPKHIAQGRTGGAAALGQIFRDREDLAAAPSLSDAIRAAIAQAEALVVICSPEARNSRWVGEEIALFRKLHPGRPILAAIVRGEPGEAFPEALTAGGTEPLAADLRAGGDGEALGFLKIVAGIAAVPLDALVQRDAQRRLRRVMWITGSALAAMLVMAVMTTLALQARNEAARQRESAEGLVEYMLTDLREKLRGVGRPEVMEDVNVRAMEHYKAQGDLTMLPADGLERRARILHAMGEDDHNAGNLERAIARFRIAHQSTLALLEREPKNPDRVFAHGQSEYWIGFTALRKNELKTARKHWVAYLAQSKDLASLEPNTVRSLMELGYSHGNLCELLATKNIDVQKGIDHCEKAIVFERKAVKLEPNNGPNAMALANRLGFMADGLIIAQQFENAIRYRIEEQKLIDRLLSKDPRNFELRQRQAWPKIGLGWAEYSRNNLGVAKNSFQTAIVQLDQLSQEFPTDQGVAVAQVRAKIMLAMTLRKQGDSSWRDQRAAADAVLKRMQLAKQPPAIRRIEETLQKFDKERIE